MKKFLNSRKLKSDILLLYIYNTSINQHVIKSQYYLETFFIGLLDDNIGPCSNVSTLFWGKFCRCAYNERNNLKKK